MHRALITGMNGFTGKHLAGELQAAGYRVFGTAHQGEETGSDLHTVDLLDREHLREVVVKVPRVLPRCD